MKKVLYIFFILFFTSVSVARAQFIIQGHQGGTNIGTAVSGDIGKCLKVSTVSPLVWTVGTCASGGGGGSDVNWTFFNTSGLYPSTTTNQVLIGDSATTSRANLEVGFQNSAWGSLLTRGSTTLQTVTFTRATGTAATTTSFAISGVTSSLLKTNATGGVLAAILGTDYLATVAVNSPLSGDGTSGSPITLSTSGTWSGNAGTATALATNGSNCSSGNAPLGVDASGASESCFDVWTESENTSAAYTPQSRTVTVAGTANQITSSAGAQDLTANRTWTLSLPNHVIFPANFQATNSTTTNATTTGSIYFTSITGSTQCLRLNIELNLLYQLFLGW